MLLVLDLLMHRALAWLGRGSSIRSLELENAVASVGVATLAKWASKIMVANSDPRS